MILKDKVAVIYGTGGDVGSAVARAFAREGAKLFLSGRNLHKVEAVAAEVIGRGGVAEAAQIDALDEQVVEKYVSAVAEKAGAIDISFSAISIVNALPNRAPASGALDRSVCASHHDLYDGEFPHGAERGAPDDREANRRDLDDSSSRRLAWHSRTSVTMRRRLRRS
jgi:NAD(P)-dependent dehydrogenase (short-subunit alcohol dehydrogenase family)